MPANAAACPHCGSDNQTGWSDDTYLDGVDLPGSTLDNDEYRDLVDREFGPKESMPPWVWITAAVVVFAMLAWAAL